MDEAFWIFLGFLILVASVTLMVSGGVALRMAIGLRKKVRALEARIAELSGEPPPTAPASPRRPVPSPLPARPTAPASAPASSEPSPRTAPAPSPLPVPALSPPIASPTPTAPALRPPPLRRAERASFQETWETIEHRLGIRWLSWIGAIVVLVALAFLLKFLYDRNLIGPAGRVGVGLGAGLAFLLLGELRLRRLHDLLAQAVSATGVGGLFLTTFLAYKFYGFSGQLPTFGLMVWYAAFAMALAVLRRGRILAVLGLVCAYACPFLLSTGQDQAEVLFAYLAILALAGGTVRLLRDWPETTPIGLALTAIYYGGWHARFFGDDRVAVAVAGAAGVAAFFCVAALGRGARLRRPAGITDAVSAAAAEIFALYYLWESLAGEHRIALGFVLTGLGLWNVGLFWALRARRALSRVLEELLLLLAAGSLAFVIPAVLRAEGALIAWSLAAVVLADAGCRSRRVLLQAAACAALVAAPWAGIAQDVWHTGTFHFALNGIFAAWLAAAAAWLLAGQRAVALFPPRTLQHRIGRGIQVVGIAILLVLLSGEVAAWFWGERLVPGADRALLRDLEAAALLGLWALFPALYIWRARRVRELWILAAVHYAVMGLGYLVVLARLHRSDALLFLNLQFAAGVLFPAGIFAVARALAPRAPRARVCLEIYAHVLAVLLLSFEIFGVLGLREWSESREWIRTALVSVAWTLYAFVVLSLGVWRARAAWRWFALGLLVVTIAKVFFVDASQVEQIWRVVSFAVLGTLLMGSSYVYARHERKKKAEIEGDDAYSS
ncbi:MAG: DUF2339 domain-containing protein [Planctomycetes bacterium]|nr:DUF2339 domain-containing protein [Planctomycetota bacterium]